MYTDDKASQIVLALLKKYGIKRIVISPGTTNVPISRAVQLDSFFEAYSVVDERGAAYFATGLAFATGEPVAISCTGATASRNYLSGLTEAYYRNLPVIALTSQHHSPAHMDLLPQVTDRRVSQNDVKRFAALLPMVKDEQDMRTCVTLVNKALQTTLSGGGGPVHINIPVSNLYGFTTKTLPDVTKISYHTAEDLPADALSKELAGKKVGVFIGAHRPFSRESLAAVNRFVKAYDATVFYDHTSSYTGRNRILTSVAGDLLQISDLPDVIVDLGSVCGDYSAARLFRGRPTWRISEDGEYYNRQNLQDLRRVFACSERLFFDSLSQFSGGGRYFSSLKKQVASIKIPTLPLSNTYISSRLATAVPKRSFLHMGILNSLRNMDFFEVDKTVITSCNVGGFGIDGALSTLIGQSVSDTSRLAFCLLGDLAFFYDMNALGIRHVNRNLRILMVNNGRGAEFRLNKDLERQWGSDTDEFISAAGHFGSCQAWSEAMGFRYLRATTKDEFDALLGDFCNPDIAAFPKPVVFEVFTDIADEQQALHHIRSMNQPIKKA